jgi:beta-galactosidase
LKNMLRLFLVAVLFAGPTAYAERTDLLINSGWKFQKGDAEAYTATFDDADWDSVTLPHTWNAQDGQDGGSDFWRGSGWYRRTLIIEDIGDKRFYLHFEGALTTTDAYVNGKSVGQHKGGYAAFRFDITDHVQPGENVLAVKVDNALDADVPPLSGDWTFFGGIYRDLHLLVVDPVHIDLMDYGSPGVYLMQVAVAEEQAEVEVRTRVLNESADRAQVNVRIEVLDHAGQVVATTDRSKRVRAGKSFDLVEKVVVEHPHLWNGQKDPYLYTARVAVTGDDGSADVVEQPLGLRTFRVSPNRGFFLNGEHVKLHGVNRHQDRLDMGNALTAREHQEDFDLIREMGANTIRLAHYQHAEYFYDLCDQDGQIVWAELALVNGVTDSEAFNENAKRQLRELIRQNYNHPSIVMWSVFNEIRVNERFAGGGADPVPILTELNALAKQEDETRLTTSAAMTDPEDAVANLTDLQSFNRYHGWYYAKATDFGPWIDGVHEKHPNARLGISEYGAGASAFIHSRDPVAQDHSEEWQNVFHEIWWQAVEARPYIWGSHIWNMFDFASDMRDEGDHKGRNDKGLVTYDRKVKKDPFFYYKANWSTEPVVHITGRRFQPRKRPSIDVKVYANEASVELMVNGVSLGRIQSDNHVFVWGNVPFGLGDNQVTAIGRSKGRTTTDVVIWVREKSEDAVLSSSVLAVHEEGKFIANPYGLTVSALADLASISPGATAVVVDEAGNPAQDDAPVADGIAMIVTAEDGEHTARYPVVYGPVSLGKSVSAASSSPGGFGFAKGPAENANDGNPETAWMGGFAPPYWWVTDLGTQYHVARLDLNWPTSKDGATPGAFAYRVEVSDDGKSWAMAADGTSNVTSGKTSDSIGKVGQFVRITIDSSTVLQTVHLFQKDIEFKVNGILEASVHGGLIVSDVVKIDYAGRLISASMMSDAELMAKCSGVAGAVLRVQEGATGRQVIVSSLDGQHVESYEIR